MKPVSSNPFPTINFVNQVMVSVSIYKDSGINTFKKAVVSILKYHITYHYTYC